MALLNKCCRYNRKHDKEKAKHESKASQYRIRNWSAYNQSLKQRGSITLWISEAVLANWHPEAEGLRPCGGQVQYSDQAIECLLMLKAVYRLPYRQTVGFGQSVMDLLGAGVRVPDYTGLKVYGEGEWKVRQHSYSKRRTWRKLHLSVDEHSQEIQALVLSEAEVDDAAAGQQLLRDTPGEIEQLSGDGSYDKAKFYAACSRRKVKHLAIPPRRNAKIWQHGNCKKEPLSRDQNLRRIRQVGRKQWKIESGYHRRSLAETAVFRFKIIFGNRLSARTLHRQITEARIRGAALNRMTLLGMPDSYRVA